MNQRRPSRTSRHRAVRAALPVALLGAVLTLGLVACATPGQPGSAADAPDGSSLGSLWPAPPEGEVIGQGTVLDTGQSPRLCLGAVRESYPPQCDGIPLRGWSWDGIDGSETADDVTWGMYAVQGTYDGESFTMTQPPILLALYDPMAPADPTGGTAGTTDDATLVEVQKQVHDRLGAEVLSSGVHDGRLWVDVLWDDGTWQDAAADDFGENTVIIRSALVEAGAER